MKKIILLLIMSVSFVLGQDRILVNPTYYTSPQVTTINEAITDTLQWWYFNIEDCASTYYGVSFYPEKTMIVASVANKEVCADEWTELNIIPSHSYCRGKWLNVLVRSDSSAIGKMFSFTIKRYW